MEKLLKRENISKKEIHPTDFLLRYSWKYDINEK